MKAWQWRDEAMEKAVLSEVGIQEPWALLERFNRLVRESGSAEEMAAVKYITGKLDAWNISYNLYTPRLLVSLPRGASLRVVAPESKVIRAKTPSFSATAEGLEGELCYISSGQAGDIGEIFSSHAVSDEAAVRGKAVLTEGFPMPGKVTDLMASGAKGVIFISPGERIHEGICTNVWGSPDLDSIHRKPSIPVVSVRRSDGNWLKELWRSGPCRVVINTRLEEEWKPCPVLVAEIKGTEEPEKFILFHGHLDSWHAGITDNATGNAVLLEVARVLAKHQASLKRSVRVAWWSGHSHGRYAGSTWYADSFALDILENCLAHVNCDSPGSRGATVYRGVMWMKEFEDLCTLAIKDAVGQTPTGARVLRAGDCAFNNLGVSTFYMLTSSIPVEARKQLGLYAVGGSGGNNEWHHEDDTLEVADKDILLNDLKVFLVSLVRFANAPVLPYNFVKTAEEVLNTVKRYQEQARGFDLSGVIREAGAFLKAAQHMVDRQDALQGRPINDPQVRRLNKVLLRVSRTIVPVNYVREDRFKHDPAVENPPVPDLARAVELATVPEESDRYHLLCSHLRRGANRVTWALRQARGALEDTV